MSSSAEAPSSFCEVINPNKQGSSQGPLYAALGAWFAFFLMKPLDAEISWSISCYLEEDDDAGVP